MNLQGKPVTLHDMCLRDGMHPMRHQITVAQMIDIATGLDEAGVPLIEVTPGDGLGGASLNYGFPAASDEEYLRAVVGAVQQAKISALPSPVVSMLSMKRGAVPSPSRRGPDASPHLVHRPLSPSNRVRWILPAEE